MKWEKPAMSVEAPREDCPRPGIVQVPDCLPWVNFKH